MLSMITSQAISISSVLGSMSRSLQLLNILSMFDIHLRVLVRWCSWGFQSGHSHNSVKQPNASTWCTYNQYRLFSGSSVCIRRYKAIGTSVYTIFLQSSDHFSWCQFTVFVIVDENTLLGTVIFPTENGVPLHTAFHYQSLVILIWLKCC